MIKVDFTPREIVRVDFSPRVFMKDRTHSYLLLREQRGKGLFLTMEAGTIEVVKVPQDDQGEYFIQERNEGMVDDKEVKFINYPLVPYPRDLSQAARVYWESTLPKSAAADRELRLILGIAASEVSPSDRDDQPHSGATSLASICLELGIEASRGRKLLRGVVEKPGERWEWADPDDLARVREALGGSKPS